MTRVIKNLMHKRLMRLIGKLIDRPIHRSTHHIEPVLIATGRRLIGNGGRHAPESQFIGGRQQIPFGGGNHLI